MYTFLSPVKRVLMVPFCAICCDRCVQFVSEQLHLPHCPRSKILDETYGDFPLQTSANTKMNSLTEARAMNPPTYIHNVVIQGHTVIPFALAQRFTQAVEWSWPWLDSAAEKTTSHCQFQGCRVSGNQATCA